MAVFLGREIQINGIVVECEADAVMIMSKACARTTILFGARSALIRQLVRWDPESCWTNKYVHYHNIHNCCLMGICYLQHNSMMHAWTPGREVLKQLCSHRPLVRCVKCLFQNLDAVAANGFWR